MYFARIYQRGPLMHAPPDGGPETEVVPSLRDVASFAVGDKGIYFVPESNDAIRFLDFGSGEVRDVLSLDRPYAWGMDLTADGRTLFWSETTIDNSDLVYIEDFQSPTVLGTTVFEPN